MKMNDKIHTNNSGYFRLNEIAKIVEQVPDFTKKVCFDVCDLQQYDPEVFVKLDDKNLYTLIADINLHRAVTFYGGENVFIYMSTKENGHYIYSRYCWGD